MGIERRGLELFMSEQHLDGADVFSLFEQMGGKRVAQRMHRDALVDVRGHARLRARRGSAAGYSCESTGSRPGNK